MPACSPRCDERLGERLRAQEDDRGRVREQDADDDAPLRRWAASPISARRSDEVRFLRRRAPDADHEHDEDADEDRPSRTSVSVRLNGSVSE